MHPSKIALAVALFAAPLSLASPSYQPIANPALMSAAASPSTEATSDGRKLEDAPVPSIERPGVSPADRVAQPGTHSLDAGPSNATPFSSAPAGTLSDGGTQVAEGDRTQAPSGKASTLPNLGR